MLTDQKQTICGEPGFHHETRARFILCVTEMRMLNRTPANAGGQAPEDDGKSEAVSHNLWSARLCVPLRSFRILTSITSFVMRFAHCVFLVVCLIGSSCGSAEDLSCLSPEERLRSDAYQQLRLRATAALDRRLQALEQVRTPEQIHEYQGRLRQFFLKQLGDFPDRVTLSSRTVRVIRADGYRIECVIFASRPHHHITANLYLPDAERPVPGVAVSSGHSRTAKTADYNQRFGIAMARQGIAALVFDPIGQGERSQILDEDHHPEHQGTTTEHFLIGVGSTLVGRNTASYRIWDAMRAIDYLQSRPEIDGTRIGFTGCSGGGTLTSYVMALDDRVICAAPACYLTTFQRLIDTIGPQDAEQNIFGQIEYGLDHPDYILMRAPRPTLISATTQDFFDAQGTWENFRQAKRLYGRMGYPERVDLVEIEGNHGVQPQNLATIAHWMTRWLLGIDRSIPAEEIVTRSPEELLCLETGQVLSLPGEKSVFDLNAESASELAMRRAERPLSDVELRKKIRSILRLRPAADVRPPQWEDRGRVPRADYHIDRLILKCDSGVIVPGLTYHPVMPSEDACLYLHDEGKAADGQPGGPIEAMVHTGVAVVSVDLRGQGETTSGKRDPLLTDWKTYSLAYLLGDSMIGLRTADALAAADFVAWYQKDRSGSPRNVHLVADGQSGIVALHAAALHPELFASVTLKGTPRDWTTIVGDSAARGQLDSVIHGVLETYDLPDLVRLAGDGKVVFTEDDRSGQAN